ncbi:MAG: FAD-dependent oxidoreductase [Solirubrobacterales bacterium]|nr:FAD-dependent oxidoreductase [Solirubrobacterales bacterium]
MYTVSIATGLETIVVVGASLAGYRAAEALRAEGFDGWLVIIGEEPHLPYDRPPLSKDLLAGKLEPSRVQLRGVQDLEAEWMLGEAATALDLHARCVCTAAGNEISFDGLVIATGSRPRRLAAVDPAHPGIHELRTLDDALALSEELQPGRRVAIVGAGFIGMEVASTAVDLGAHVTMVSLLEPIEVAGALATEEATRRLEANGVELHIGRTVKRVQGNPAHALMLDDGSHVDVEVIVSAVGVTPATEWLVGSGLELDNGILCDERLAVVGAERVVAAGDVARWPNPRCGGAPMRIEHWTNAGEQGRAAARTLLHGAAAEPFASVPFFWSQHFEARMQSAGLPEVADRFEIVEGSPDEGKFAAAGYREGRLVAALSWNAPRALVALRAKLSEPLIPS